MGTSTWSPRRYLVWIKVSPLGSGLIWRLAGQLLLEKEPAVTCKRTWASDCGNRRDFLIGCPLCAAAVRSCNVLGDRWIQPHLAARTWFAAERWTATFIQPCRVTSLLPASWVNAVDKSRDSRSAEVRRIGEIYDECLGLVSAEDAFQIEDALDSGDVSRAWLAWSIAAGTALVGAHRLALFLRGASAWVGRLRVSMRSDWAVQEFAKPELGMLTLVKVLRLTFVGTAELPLWASESRAGHYWLHWSVWFLGGQGA